MDRYGLEPTRERLQRFIPRRPVWQFRLVVIGWVRPCLWWRSKRQWWSWVCTLLPLQRFSVAAALMGFSSNHDFVALSGDGSIIAIGADDGNYAVIYRNEGTDWVQIGQTSRSEASGDFLGFSLSLSFDGSTVVIGGLCQKLCRVRINGSLSAVSSFDWCLCSRHDCFS